MKVTPMPSGGPRTGLPQATHRPHAPKLWVSVTREIIDQAQRRDSSHCMIADAIKAAFPRGRSISVDLATCRVTDPERGLRYIYLTPRSGQIALVDFDQGRPTEPFRMRLQGGAVIRSQGKGAKEPRKDQGQMPPGGKTVLALHGDESDVPVRVGGKAPPTGALTNKLPRRNAGKMRAFGLRGLDR